MRGSLWNKISKKLIATDQMNFSFTNKNFIFQIQVIFPPFNDFYPKTLLYWFGRIALPEWRSLIGCVVIG